MGRRRWVLPIAVHLLAAAATIEIARGQTWMWTFVGLVILSAVAECARARREFGALHELGLCPDGITVDALVYRARRAWLGPGWTAVWLAARGHRRRLLYVFRGEVTDADHAALRRHIKALDFAA